MSSYLSSNKGGFFSVEDDVDDDTFLAGSKPGNSGYLLTSDNHFAEHSTPRSQTSETIYGNDANSRIQSMLQQKEEIEKRTIESSARSLSLLRDTEMVGSATAEELVRQREQLELTERRIDDINNTLRFSQKHINGIKSMFGSLKNYIKGSKNDPKLSPTSAIGKIPDLTEDPVTAESRSNLKDYINAGNHLNSNPDNHPGLRIRGLCDNENDPFGRQAQTTKPKVNVQEVLDNNLDEMAGSIARLKGLALDLGGEIEQQNDLIDNIMVKTEKADFTLNRQQKEINRLLNKK